MNQDEKFFQLFQLAQAINAHKCIYVSVEYNGIFECVDVTVSSNESGQFKFIYKVCAYLDNRFESLGDPTLDQLLHRLEQILECIEVGRTPTQKVIEFGWNDVTATYLTDESLCAFAGLAVYPHTEDDQLKRVHVLEGEWFFNEERLLLTGSDSHHPIKILKSDKAVLNSACRYGIDARRVRFMEGGV